MLNTPLVTPKLADLPPAFERASSTLALGPVSRVEGQVASNPTTPGLHVPGAYPDPYPKAAVVQQDAQYVKDAAIDAFQTTKGYVSTSVEDIKRLMENAGNTVGGYLSQSVAAYLPHPTTVDAPPSSEPNSQDMRSASLSKAGTHPVHRTPNVSLPSEEASQNIYSDSSGGASNLPGTPDERISSRISKNHSEALRSETDFAILPEDRRQQNLPSRDDDLPFVTETGKSISSGGGGALPGDKEEVGLALLPEERNSLAKSECGASTDASTRLLRSSPSSKFQDQDISQYTLAATGSVSLALLPSTPDKNTTASSMYAPYPIIPNTTARTHPVASDGVKFKGVPLLAGFQEGIDEKPLSPIEKCIDERRNLEQEQSDVATSAAAAAVVGPRPRAGQETVRKKPGFMDKLKGEVRVISGKLSRKERKEEGKRMGKNWL